MRPSPCTSRSSRRPRVLGENPQGLPAHATISHLLPGGQGASIEAITLFDGSSATRLHFGDGRTAPDLVTTLQTVACRRAASLRHPTTSRTATGPRVLGDHSLLSTLAAPITANAYSAGRHDEAIALYERRSPQAARVLGEPHTQYTQ